MRFFGGRKRATARDRLVTAVWTCVACGDEHEGVFDLAAFAPDLWDGPEEYAPNPELRMDGDFLSEDFCVVGGEHFFVRCVFEIPVHGLDEKFGFGVWSTLSRRNFDIYVDGFDEARFADLGPWTGWFSNRIATFEDTLYQPCWVHPQLASQRPVISFHDEGHELAAAQRDGISAERLMELYAAYGHAPA